VVFARPGAGAPGRFRLPPSSRITRTRDIRALLRKGKRKKTSHLDVFFLSSGGSLPRLGLVVPKHRQDVVNRNKVKRRLREIGRRDVLPRIREVGLGVDLLIRARREAYEASFQGLRRELIEITEELCSGHLSLR
jgi:ribonuclease P protein component